MHIRNVGPTPKRSIYKEEDKTIVAFGSGSIQMGIATDDHHQIMVHLADVMRSHPIGLEPGPWEGAKGESVILGFNRIESIDVLIKTLQEARDYLAT